MVALWWGRLHAAGEAGLRVRPPPIDLEEVKRHRAMTGLNG
jgi:hypothetical protein